MNKSASNINSINDVVEFGVFHWVAGMSTSLPCLTSTGLPCADYFSTLRDSGKGNPDDMADCLRSKLNSWWTNVTDKPLILCSGGVDSSTLVATASTSGQRCDLLHTAYTNHNANDLLKLSRLIETFPAHCTTISVNELAYREGLKLLWKEGVYENTYGPTIAYALDDMETSQFDTLVTGSGPDELFYGMEKYSLDYFESLSHLSLLDALEEIDVSYNIDAYKKNLNKSGLEILDVVIEKRKKLYQLIADVSETIVDAQRLLAYCTVTTQHMNMFDGLAERNGLKHIAPFLEPEIVKLAFSIRVAELYDSSQNSTKVEVGKFHLKKYLETFMSHDHAWSNKIGFHAPTTKYMYKFNEMNVFENLNYESLSAIFDIDKLKNDLSLRFSGGIDKHGSDYFLYSILNLSSMCNQKLAKELK